MNAEISTKNEMSVEERLLRIDEVALRMNISRSLAYRLVKSGEIPSVRFGATVRVRECDLEEFVRRSWSGWKQT